MSVEYVVITKTGPYPGNHATCLGSDFWLDGQFQVDGRDKALRDSREGLQLLLGMREPVFHPGEILIVDPSTGRELGGAGRKPSKWDVQYETFEDVEEAVTRARQVLDEAQGVDQATEEHP